MNKLTAEKCREQFEEWLTRGASDLSKALLLDKFISGGYSSNIARIQWEAWQASRQVLEVALPILEQQERGERQERGEWIEWKGGEQPVNGDVLVETKWSDGSVSRGEASDWRWEHHSLLSNLNLIAYRIIPERATNQNGEQ